MREHAEAREELKLAEEHEARQSGEAREHSEAREQLRSAEERKVRESEKSSGAAAAGLAALAAVQRRLDSMEAQQTRLKAEVAALRAQREADHAQREVEHAQREVEHARADAMQAAITKLQAGLEIQRTHRRLSLSTPMTPVASHRLPSPQAEISSHHPHQPLPADGIRCMPSCASTDASANTDAAPLVPVAGTPPVPAAKGLPQPSAAAAAEGSPAMSPARRVSLQLPGVHSRAGQPQKGGLRQPSNVDSSTKPKPAPSRVAFFLGRRSPFAKSPKRLEEGGGCVQENGMPAARSMVTV